MENIETQIKQQGLALTNEAAALQVVDQESATRVSGIVANMKDTISKWKAYWKPLKAKAKAVHAEVCDKEAELLKRVGPAMVQLSSRLATWTMAEREKARRDQEIREKAEWEARQKEREAESKLEEVIDFEEASRIAEAAKPTAPLPPAPAQPVLDGLSMRDHWKFRVVEFDLVPKRFLMVDERAVQAEIDDRKDKRAAVEFFLPLGIEVYNDPIIASKRR